MKYLYIVGLNIFLGISFLSNTKLLSKIDKIESYNGNVVKGFIYSFTKVSWNYGFFSSKNINYLSYNLTCYNKESKDTLKINNNYNSNFLASKYNYIRINTLFPGIFRDSVYKEVCTRSIALYLFRKYGYSHMDFIITHNSMSVSRVNQKFQLSTKTDTVFNNELYY
jgi:hypothetical protein